MGADVLSRSVKDYLIKIMREKPNIDQKDDILTYIYAMESDETAKQAADRKERISLVDALIDCRVCGKKHKKKVCGYQCKHCGMKGSHKENSCWKAFPHLKRGGQKEDDRKRRERDFRSKSRSQSRDRRPRYEKDRAPVSRTGERAVSYTHLTLPTILLV